MESTHGLLPCLCNLCHFAQLVRGANCKVKETQLLKVFRLLVCNLDNAVVALGESGLTEATPRFRSIKLAGRFDCDVQVSTFDGELKAGLFILYEVQCNLRCFLRTNPIPQIKLS